MLNLWLIINNYACKRHRFVYPAAYYHIKLMKNVGLIKDVWGKGGKRYIVCNMVATP